MLIDTNSTCFRGSGWHHSCFAQQGFPSLPGGDNHQKILGQGSGIKLTPTYKGERNIPIWRNIPTLPPFSFLQLDLQGTGRQLSYLVQDIGYHGFQAEATPHGPSWPLLLFSPPQGLLTSVLNFALITHSLSFLYSHHIVLFLTRYCSVLHVLNFI